MIKRFIAAILLISIVISCFLCDTAWAFPTKTHNKYIETVLFGEDGYAVKSGKNAEEIKKVLDLLETAVYLCIDQHNAPTEDRESSTDAEKLSKLININRIKWTLYGFVRDISEITVGGNDHRKYTHMGWNYNYIEEGRIDKANWEKRKEILLCTVSFEFGFHIGYGKEKWEKQCDSFCSLIYYIHILSDHLEEIQKAKNVEFVKYEESPDMMGIVDIINELVELGDDLFIASSQKWKTEMKPDLEIIQNKFYRIGSKINKEEDFKKYDEYMNDLWNNILEEYIHSYLKSEDFFSNVFYKIT